MLLGGSENSEVQAVIASSNDNSQETLDPPKSRSERILYTIVNGEDISALGPPKSREEKFLMRLAENLRRGIVAR